MRNLNRLLLLLSALPVVVWPALGHAEGSCTWNDVTPILDSQPGLRAFLEASFSLSPGGSAMRLGKEFEALEGRRVGPYRFDATSRQDANLLLELVIETKPEFIDEKGALLPPGTETAGVVVRERFAAIRLEPIPAESSSGEGLTEAQQAERVAWTQARCNQLHLADHQIQTLDFPPGGKLTGKAIYHHAPASNELQYFTVDALSTNGATISESFYFNDGELFFVLRRQPSPSPAQPGSELRYYVQNGQILKATRKAILPQGAAVPPVMEESVQVPASESNNLLVRVSRLALAADPAEVAEDYAAILQLP
jgi:hypothetical protein